MPGFFNDLQVRQLESQHGPLPRGEVAERTTPRGRLRVRVDAAGTLTFLEYVSHGTLGSWPLVHSVSGVDPATGKRGAAKGIVATGWRATGVVATGKVAAVGVVATGGVAVGVVTTGFVSLGLLVGVGALATGAAAVGGAAAGLVAVGGAAAGLIAVGGFAAGVFQAVGVITVP